MSAAGAKKEAIARSARPVFGAVAALGLSMALSAAAPSRPGSPATPRATTPAAPAVAVVGGVSIPRGAFEARMREALGAYENQGAPLPPSALPIARRQVLEGMIRERLLALEAARRGYLLTPAEAEEELKKDPFFQVRGAFDQTKFVSVKLSQPERFQQAIEQIRRLQPALRLKAEMDRAAEPDSVWLHDQVASGLTRASVETLEIPLRPLGGDGDEPTAVEVSAYYRAHLADYHRAEQVRVTLMRVNRPPLDNEQLANEQAIKAWEARMEQRADSLLKLIAKGQSLEGLAGDWGGLRPDVTIERDGFPAEWRGGPATREALFAAAPGTFLSPSVPSTSGRLVVRVDAHLSARTAPLKEVSEAIRAQLLEERARSREESDLRALYPALRDSLTGVGYRIRYAIADTGTIAVPEPTEPELERYYQVHQSDYSRYDAATSAVVVTPYARVRDAVRLRMLKERRRTTARTSAEALWTAWRQGTRDAALEKVLVPREVGPMLQGGDVDAGWVSDVLRDSLAADPRSGARIAPAPRGWVVFQVVDHVANYSPPFEQCRPLLKPRLTARRAAEDEAFARTYYEQHPERFIGNRRILISRLMVEPLRPERVPLTREEVTRWYNNHPDDYGAGELIHVRHILIEPKGPGPGPEGQARAEAEAILQQLKGGADFAQLAAEHSDDESTRERGGEIGVFRRGMMLPDFEAICFSLRDGEIKGPVRTQLGWHVIECLDHTPGTITPLRYCYGAVALAAARDKGYTIARDRADSLRRTLKTVAQARAPALRRQFLYLQDDHVVGSTMVLPGLRPFLARLENMKAGEMYPDVQRYQGLGYAVTWVDSLLPPRRQTWEEARPRALEESRAGRTVYARLARARAELDSLGRLGFSLDSLASTWGGLRPRNPAAPGEVLAAFGDAARVDSLVFGPGPARLAPGQTSGWIELPGGLARVRLLSRVDPDAGRVAAQFEARRRAEVERNLRKAFDEISRRFRVEIFDPDLRVTELPSVDPS